MAPRKWYSLLAFAHVSERSPDAPREELDPLQEVKRQAHQVLGKELKNFLDVRQDSSAAIPAEGEISFVPEIRGIEFKPPRATFLWLETVHREHFRLRAAPELEGQTARGRLSVFLGARIIADVPLAIRVVAQPQEEPATQPNEAVSATPYRKVFVSYSHKDLAVVEQFERCIIALGDQYLRDSTALRAGEVWSDRLAEMIREADIFQLFWSSNSMRSAFVRQEWEHALALNRQNFVRPVYWEEPMPQDSALGLPPEPLRQLHFHPLHGHISASHGEGEHVQATKPEVVAKRPAISPSITAAFALAILASISVFAFVPAAGEWAARAVVTVNSGARKWLESQFVPRAEVDSQFTPDSAVSDLQLALTNVSATAREGEETKAALIAGLTNFWSRDYVLRHFPSNALVQSYLTNILKRLPPEEMDLTSIMPARQWSRPVQAEDLLFFIPRDVPTGTVRLYKSAESMDQAGYLKFGIPYKVASVAAGVSALHVEPAVRTEGASAGWIHDYGKDPGFTTLLLSTNGLEIPGWLFLREQKRRAPFQTPRIEPIPPPTPLTNQPVMGPSAPNHAVIAVTPKNLTFVSGAAGESVTHEVRVENMGDGVLSGKAELVGTNSAFKIVSGINYSLGSNQSQAVVISYTPTGSGMDTQTIAFSGGGGATVEATGGIRFVPPPSPSDIHVHAAP